MVSASSPGWPLCREGSPWVPCGCCGCPAHGSPGQGRARQRPRGADALLCPALAPKPTYIYIYTHRDMHIYIYIHINAFIWMQPLAFPPLPPPPCPPHPTAGWGAVPPSNPTLSPPPTCPSSPSTSHKWHRRIDNQTKESRMQTWDQGRRPWLELGSCCCRCAVGAGAGMSLSPPAVEDVQAPRVLRHRARQRRVNRKRRGGNKNSLVGTLVQAWERGCAGASAPRGGTAGDHRWRGGSCRVRGDKRRRRKASRRLLPCQTHGYLPLWLSGSW